MKRILLFLTVLLLAFTTVLAACDGETTDISDASSSASAEQSEDISDTSSENTSSGGESSKEASSDTESSVNSDTDVGKNESSTPETSKPDDTPDAAQLSVIACSYSEKPYFALIGKCAEGATVTGEIDGEAVSSKSYKGLFSLRLRCDGKSVSVKISQTIDGELVGEVLEYTAKPVTPSKDMWPVVTGGDMQFFFQKMLPDFTGSNIPSSNDLDDLTYRVSHRVSQLQSVNPDAEIIYLLVPSTMTVYPELVPEQYKQATGNTKLDLVSDALRDGGATVIDLKSAFAEHKNDEMPLYYKLDSHWTDYGAFVAYTELFNHISNKHPDAKPRDINEFNWNGKNYQSGDMTYYLGMSKYGIREYSYYRTFKKTVPTSISSVPRYVSSDKLTYSNEVTYENKLYTANRKLPNAIVMRDSYSTQMYDILAERMNRTYYLGMWNYTWDNNQIETVKPDYVIYIVAEWNLDSIIYS